MKPRTGDMMRGREVRRMREVSSLWSWFGILKRVDTCIYFFSLMGKGAIV